MWALSPIHVVIVLLLLCKSNMLILLRPNMLINKLIKPKCLFRFAFMCISLQILHLCSFSMAAIINNNKLGHLHHHKCTLLHFWRSEIQNECFTGQKSRYQQDFALSRGNKEKSDFLPFPASRPALLVFLGSWPPPPSSRSAVQHLHIFLC